MANEIDEFNRHVTGGWGRIPLQKSGNIRTFKYIGIESKENPKDPKIVLEIITKTGLVKRVVYQYSYFIENVEWYLPSSKYVNTANAAVKSTAVPYRQFTKVLTLGNAYFSSPVPFTYPTEIAEKIKQNVTDVLEWYNKPYPTYDEALEDLRSGKAIMRAFDRRFLVALYPEVAHPILVFRNNLLGYDDGRSIVCIKDAERLHDTLINLTKKGIIYNEAK